MQKNRKLKLTRQLKKQPNNAAQINAALGCIVYRRHTPKNPVWTASMIAVARLFKEFGGNVNMEIFSADEKKSSAALRQPSKYAQLPVSKKKKPVKEPGMFSIEARLANGRNIGWSI